MTCSKKDYIWMKFPSALCLVFVDGLVAVACFSSWKEQKKKKKGKNV